MATDAAALTARGREALAAGLWLEAAEAFTAAVELEDEPDTAFGLAIAHWWLGNTAEALRAWKRAYVLYRRREAHAGAVEAAFYLCLAYQMSLGNGSAARGWLERGARVAAGTSGAGDAAWITVARAHLAIDDGLPWQAERWAREALDAAAALGDVDLELCATSELGAALMEMGRVGEGGALLDEAMAGAFAGESRDRDAVVLISCRTITASSRAGDLNRVIEWVAAAQDFYRRYGSPHLFATCRAQYGSVLFATGSWADAERELGAALQIARGAEEAVRADATATLAELRLAQGRPEDARRLLVGYERHAAAVLPLALVHLALGEATVAAAILRRRLREVEGVSVLATRLLDALTDAELASHAIRRAERAANDLAEVARSIVSDAVAARAARSAGQVAMARGDVAAAVEPFRRATIDFERAGLPLESARARLLLAEAVRGIDTAMAIAEGRDALTSFDSLGATRDADAAAALLRSLGSRPSRAAPLAASDLTRRELEVLTLLGEGLTNRQIADRLFITRKTVEHHVASVLAKAGLSGRTEAAAWAVRHLERAGKEQDPRIG